MRDSVCDVDCGVGCDMVLGEKRGSMGEASAFWGAFGSCGLGRAWCGLDGDGGWVRYRWIDFVLQFFYVFGGILRLESC